MSRQIIHSMLVLLVSLFSVAGCAHSKTAAPSVDRPTIDIDGQTFFISSLDEIDDLRHLEQFAEKVDPAWPKAGVLSVEFRLAQVKTGKYRRPYVAVWIENAEAKPVRFLTLWGKQAKYHRDLRDFWVFTKRNTKQVDAVTGPTRPAGAHTLVWDGNDDAGQPLPPGDYTVHIEVVREHGTRVHMKQLIACGGKAVSEKLQGNLEVESVAIRFGPPGKP